MLFVTGKDQGSLKIKWANELFRKLGIRTPSNINYWYFILRLKVACFFMFQMISLKWMKPFDWRRVYAPITFKTTMIYL